MNTNQRLERLFLAALARRPAAAENAALVKYIENGGSDHDPKRALADVFWMLLNSSEFTLNH
jgi:hypothetical protein